MYTLIICRLLIKDLLDKISEFMLLEIGADICTVSKVGLYRFTTAQIYAKIVDSKIEKVPEIIPELNIEL